MATPALDATRLETVAEENGIFGVSAGCELRRSVAAGGRRSDFSIPKAVFHGKERFDVSSAIIRHFQSERAYEADLAVVE